MITHIPRNCMKIRYPKCWMTLDITMAILRERLYLWDNSNL